MGITAEVQAHKITTPFTVQDHYMGDEFIGKLLMRKVPASKSANKHQDSDEKTKEEESALSPEIG